MAELERIGVSLDQSLLAEFDRLIAQQGYQSRSEAIRDLVRGHLSEKRLADPDSEAVATVLIVYDHHAANLTEKLVAIQHSHLVHAISSLHVHLDHHECLEVIVLRGRVREIHRLGENIVSMKGVKLGRVNLVAT
jgi:CopG family nickel-responsive transcriptional regulator